MVPIHSHTKRVILEVLGQSFILKDHTLHIKPIEWLVDISDAAKNIENQGVAIQMSNLPLDKTKTEPFGSASSVWGG